jgi:hypothetical protein
MNSLVCKWKKILSWSKRRKVASSQTSIYLVENTNVKVSYKRKNNTVI